MRPAALFLCATVGLLAGCGDSAPEPAAVPTPTQVSDPAMPASVATSREVMLGLVIPAADVVWGVASEDPADDAAWEQVAASAVMIAEGARLMTTGSRVVDQMDWITYSRAMADAATLAAKAAGEKNAEGVSEAGNALYESCEGCHLKYMAVRAGQ